ncbi:MAG: GMP synthase [Psychromonas sp.]
MKIGILQCDDVLDELQDKHGNYENMFISLLSSIDATIQFTVYRVIDDQYPKTLNECDAYIATGSRYSVNDDVYWVNKLQAFITQLYHAKKKFIGICFGHQMIAKALGGLVELSAKGWGIGIATSVIKHKPDWLQNSSEQLALVVSHKEQVVKLPEKTTIIASSAFCPNSIIQIDKHFIGIQGHPEFSKSYSLDLMQKRRAIIPAERIDTAIESLTLEVDDILVTRSLLRFLREPVASETDSKCS